MGNVMLRRTKDSRLTIIALMAGVALGVLSSSSGAMAFGHGGRGGGHFGGGGGHFGGGHFGGLGHFGGFGGRHLGSFGGGHLHAARTGRLGGAHGLAGRSIAHGNVGHHLAAHNLAARNFAGHAFAGRDFAAHGFRDGPGRRLGGPGFASSYNGFGYGGWAGPVFWPFAFDDMFGYVFSPWDYYDPFWGYGPFDILAGLYWPYAWAPYYADDGWGLPFTYGEVYGSGQARTHVARADRAAKNRADLGPQMPVNSAQMCADRAENLTGLPIDEIDRSVQPTDGQRADLDALKAASAKANQILAASCPSEPPLTPPGRLAAMENRLEAMRQAVETIRSPLEEFYGSLGDEQKARFDAMRVGTTPRAKAGSRVHGRQGLADSVEVCRAQMPDSAAFPEQDIEKTVHPTDAQHAALDELRTASLKGADLMKSSCPAQTPLTPTGRLAAVETRLDAMLQAVKAERPAMEKFYSSLSDEQKARFNAMRPQQQPMGHQG